MPSNTYRETFDNGPGGWFGWSGNRMAPIEIEDGAAVSRSPWWVDYNHAPPGAGYLHILFALYTRDDRLSREVAGVNRFIREGHRRDFTNARVTVRLKGDWKGNGAQLLLLVQSDIAEPVKTRVNSVLTGQPFIVGTEWSEQTVTCVADNGQWTCLGSRHDRMDTYGWGPIAPVLRDVSCDIILVLFPLNVQPEGESPVDRHILKAGEDYAVSQSCLPQGTIMVDTIKIAFPESLVR